MSPFHCLFTDLWKWSLVGINFSQLKSTIRSIIKLQYIIKNHCCWNDYIMQNRTKSAIFLIFLTPNAIYYCHMPKNDILIWSMWQALLIVTYAYSKRIKWGSFKYIFFLNLLYYYEPLNNNKREKKLCKFLIFVSHTEVHLQIICTCRVKLNIKSEWKLNGFMCVDRLKKKPIVCLFVCMVCNVCIFTL